MSRQMDKALYLLMLCCSTFICIYGRGPGRSPSCDVDLKVRRHTTWKAVPQHPLTLTCPFENCGEPFNITWCKVLDSGECLLVNSTENIEIRQSNKHSEGQPASVLTFKTISMNDDGLYRCLIKGYNYKQISHAINVSVSDFHQETEILGYKADPPLKLGLSPAGDDAQSWLPYFLICFCVALLVAVLTVFTLLKFYGWRRILTSTHAEGQERSTRMMPDLPKGSAPSSLFLPSQFSSPHTIQGQSTTGRPQSQPAPAATGNQPAVANAADRAVYATINHQRLQIPAREKSEYAAINFS
ncbi:uncharacterized protein V6R79_001994 [Siganus canaliculatus]